MKIDSDSQSSVPSSRISLAFYEIQRKAKEKYFLLKFCELKCFSVLNYVCWDYTQGLIHLAFARKLLSFFYPLEFSFYLHTIILNVRHKHVVFQLTKKSSYLHEAQFCLSLRFHNKGFNFFVFPFAQNFAEEETRRSKLQVKRRKIHVKKKLSESKVCTVVFSVAGLKFHKKSI